MKRNNWSGKCPKCNNELDVEIIAFAGSSSISMDICKKCGYKSKEIVQKCTL